MTGVIRSKRVQTLPANRDQCLGTYTPCTSYNRHWTQASGQKQLDSSITLDKNNWTAASHWTKSIYQGVPQHDHTDKVPQRANENVHIIECLHHDTRVGGKPNLYATQNITCYFTYRSHYLSTLSKTCSQMMTND